MLRSISVTIISIVLTSVFLGCSENPEDKAAKEIRAGVDQALGDVASKADYTSASQKLEGVLSRNQRDAGEKAVPGLLAAGNITLGQAEMMKANLGSVHKGINDRIESLSQTVREAADIELQKNTLEQLAESTEKQLETLKETLNGTSDSNSVEARLAQVNIKIEQLKGQIADLDNKLGQLKQKENEIQTQADTKFRKADLASGDQASELKQEGYDLLMSKNNYYVDIQELTDQIDDLQSRIDLLAPLKDRLERSRRLLAEKIANIQDVPERTDINEQIDDLRSRYQASLTAVNDSAAKLLERLQAYQAQVNGVASVFEASREEYLKKARRGVLSRDTTDAAIAQCYYGTGRLLSESQRFLLDNGERVASLATAADDSVNDKMTSVIEFCTTTSQEWRSQAMENLDSAIQAFDELTGQIRGDDQARCAVLKSELLAVHTKRSLADEMGSLDVYDAAVTKIDELTTAVAECDEDFSTSSLARFITEGVYYIPSLKTEEIIVKKEEPEEEPAEPGQMPGQEPGKADPNSLW
ncbi:chromosome segregation protein [Anaerohalosphaera lusitana]|uniref:Chromosome segregation protein n=1 Tax=Anaerohalosphaera lusitana TaxID=1936003 RepID=A0A1U9NLJ9_9BACT|nr:hypothetical protein [Anaerohalosphaera lusitana]AQT68614.1 chromosome segregation protein [Anaerohalosphaera lusitana]